ncbi:ATP-binding protein [Streptomyces sp. NPDC053474]|uniref:ATP-binding protein n=1 Tax=Streptomyces sp. NPDC053474 TaxID=3365704 RepID=UPI0037D13420
MEQVTAVALMAALPRAAALPRHRDALRVLARTSAAPATAALVRAWAATEAGHRGPEVVHAVAEALAADARERPLLAVALTAWLTELTDAEPDLARPHDPGHPEEASPARGAGRRPDPATANTIGPGAHITGPVLQAHGIHGDVHIHPAARPPSPPAPRQLPPVPAHFTNRRTELAALDRLVAAARHPSRIVVISGPAGVGKTALARRWLLAHADAFPDGQLYADLRGHADDGPARPNELLGEFLRALGHEQPPAELRERAALWRTATAGARIAVLLDNALSAAQVRPLLPGTQRALTVVTSRGRLTGLGMDGAAFQPLDVLAAKDAVRLLSRRVGADRVHREPEAALRVATACAGLPLAVCVAAARLAARPRQPLAAMAGALGRGAAPALDALRIEGEYAVRGALDASYRQLEPELARCYRCLGLAPVAVLTPPVAAAACRLGPGDDAVDVLDELAEVNLLEDLGPDPRTGLGRYRFHDLVRAHAQRLAEAEETAAEAAAAVRRVVDYHLAAATAAEALLSPSHRTLRRDYAEPVAQEPPFADAPGALRWLDAERTQLMTVLRTAEAKGMYAGVWQLADALWPMFLRLRPYDLWIEAHERGLAAARRAGDREGESRMLTSGGTGLRNVGRHDEAIAWFTQALRAARDEVARLTGHPDGGGPALAAAHRAEAQALHGIGQSCRLAGRLAEAADHFERALALREAVGHRRGTALTRICLGDVALAAGRPDDALGPLARARVDLLAEDDPYDAARALAFIGHCRTLIGGGERAVGEEQLRAALAEFEATGATHWQGRVLEMLGESAEDRGDPAAALHWYEGSLARYTSAGAPDTDRLARRIRQLPPPDPAAPPAPS